MIRVSPTITQFCMRYKNIEAESKTVGETSFPRCLNMENFLLHLSDAFESR